jgi:response regulator RpfG family c-di-GMP phosphodiesterase
VAGLERQRPSVLPYQALELTRSRGSSADWIGFVEVGHARILLKPGRLTEDEFEQMKSYTTIGAKLLSGSRSLLLQLSEEIALTHHERWDGSGYMGLVGTDIPLAARITAVVDVCDALTHRRSYKGSTHDWEKNTR